jgi:hypothetical protein
MITDLKWVEGLSSPMETGRWAEEAWAWEVGVSPDWNGDCGTVAAAAVVVLGIRGLEAVEVAADADVCLDDGFATEDDVLGPLDLGAAWDFVSGVLGVGGCGKYGQRSWFCFAMRDRLTVSMYSPLTLLGGIVRVWLGRSW